MGWQLRIVASFAPKKNRHHLKKTVSKLGMVVHASKPGWSRRIATSSKLTWTTKPDPNSKQTNKIKDLLMKWKEVIDDLIYREKYLQISTHHLGYVTAAVISFCVLWVYIYVHVGHVCICTCRGQRSQQGNFLCWSPPYFVSQGPSRNPGSLFRLDWWASKLPEAVCLYPPSP